MSNVFTEWQVRRNHETIDNGAAAAPHRKQITAAIVANKPEGDAGRVCIIGAGNCHDIDLPQLCDAYSEVHLVDLDGSAVQAGLERQGCQDRPQIHIHAGVDVTGVWDELSDRAGDHRAASDGPEFNALLEHLQSARVPGVPGPFDVTVSVCVLSQLVEALVATVGERHPRLVDALQALRRGHVQRLADWTRSGGTVLIASDFVSSLTAPQLPDVAEAELPRYVISLVNAANFFHGLNPWVLLNELETGAKTDANCPWEDPRLWGIWRWQLGPRTYAVAGLGFTRR